MGCIYQIKNLVTSDVYVGSTIKANVRQRTHFNLLRKNKHFTPYLQNAFNKYGENSFIFEIIEEDIPIDILAIREQYYLDNLHPKYNSQLRIQNHPGKYCVPGKREVSPETRKKLSIAHTGRIRPRDIVEKIRKLQIGKKQPLETRLKRAKSMEEPILQLDISGNIIKEWSSATEAGKQLNIRRAGIYSMIHGGMDSYKGYVWRYKNKKSTNWKLK